jgi:hypothetical protein
MAIDLVAASNEYLEVEDSAVLSFGDASNDSPFTIITWAKPHAFDFWFAVKHVFKTNSTFAMEYNFSTAASGKVQGGVYDADNTVYLVRRDNAAATANEWHLYALTYNGNGSVTDVKCYIDAAQVDDDSFTGGVYVAMHDTVAKLIIGRLNTNYSDGEFFDMRIYHRVVALVEMEIIRDHKGNDRIVDGLVMRLPMVDKASGVGVDVPIDVGPNALVCGPQGTPTHIAAPFRII